MRGKNAHQAPETQVCVDIYSGVPEAYLNVTNPEYASGTPQARLRYIFQIRVFSGVPGLVALYDNRVH